MKLLFIASAFLAISAGTAFAQSTVELPQKKLCFTMETFNCYEQDAAGNPTGTYWKVDEDGKILAGPFVDTNFKSKYERIERDQQATIQEAEARKAKAEQSLRAAQAAEQAASAAQERAEQAKQRLQVAESKPPPVPPQSAAFPAPAAPTQVSLRSLVRAKKPGEICVQRANQPRGYCDWQPDPDWKPDPATQIVRPDRVPQQRGFNVSFSGCVPVGSINGRACVSNHRYPF